MDVYKINWHKVKEPQHIVSDNEYQDFQSCWFSTQVSWIQCISSIINAETMLHHGDDKKSTKFCNNNISPIVHKIFTDFVKWA